MLKKIAIIFVILGFNTVLYPQQFETEFNLWNSGLYVAGDSIPVEVRIRITLDNASQGSPLRRIVDGNRTFSIYEGCLYMPGSIKAHDIVKFTIIDANGNNIAERSSRRTDPNFSESRVLYSGQVGNVTHLHDWFELDKEGLYFVSARWHISTDDGQIYTGQTDKKAFRVISAQGKKIYELTKQTMCMSQVALEDLRPCELELVTIGESAMPYILLCLQDFRNDMPWMREVKRMPLETWSLPEVVSQIGSERGRQIIADTNDSLNTHKPRYFERIDIWQSPDRYDKLIAKLSDADTVTVKWAIYKLGILGDSCAIPVLEQVEQRHESLDIRETAKDALAHLKDSSVPMYYRRHDPSEKIVLSSSKTIYQLGERIEINCKLIAGPYGSNELVQFSKPSYHFLPWGISSEPYRIQLRFDIRHDSFGKEMPKMMSGMPSEIPAVPGGMPGLIKKVPPPPGVNEYGGVSPIRELQTAQRYLANMKQEPLDGYISTDILGTCEPLNLGPNETRECTLSNLDSCFNLDTPGQYKIDVYIPLFKASSNSNQIMIKICDPNSK